MPALQVLRRRGPRRQPVAEAESMRAGAASRLPGGAAIEEDAFDIDVAALHQGFLRQLRAAGGDAGTAAPRRLGSSAGQWKWEVETSASDMFPPPVSSTPPAPGATRSPAGRRRAARPGAKRRTGGIIDPAPWHVADWPMVERRRAHLVRPARGAHPADGLARGRDANPPARRAARRAGRRHCHRPHAAGAGHRGAPGRAELGRAAHLHARRQPRLRLGGGRARLLLVRGPRRLRHPNLPRRRPTRRRPDRGPRPRPGWCHPGPDRPEALRGGLLL